MTPLFEDQGTASAFRAVIAATLGTCLGLAGTLAIAQENPSADAVELAPLEESAEDEQTYREMIKELSRSQSAKGAEQFCAVIVGSDGQLAPSPEADKLSSTSYGGRAGQAEVVASNNSYALSIDAPLGFSLAPSGANDSLVMTASFSGFGATSFSATPGNVPVRLKQGSTTLSINLEATKTSSLFPAGQYRAEIVLRCE